MEITKYQVRVAKKEKVSDKVYLVNLELVSPSQISFIPGQFISIEIGENLRRSYSIASSPSAENSIDLLVDIAPGGPGSKFFENIKEGDMVNFLGPMGKFTLASEGGEIVFLAASTGIAPFHSMIDYLLSKEANAVIYLYWGFRYQKDVYWKEYFEELAVEYSNFHFTLTLSRPEEGWQGKSGYVQGHVEEDLFGKSHFYVCGGSKMAEGVVDFLKGKNISEDRIHFEPF